MRILPLMTLQLSYKKKSLFSPYLQYLILLNKEVNNKKGENEEEVIRKIKNEQINNNSMAGGYIVLNKDIKGSWTNPEIMKNIKKQRVVNNELNLLLPLKCVVYDCSTFNKYVKEERLMYYIRLYQKVNIEHHPFYIDIVVETINEEDTYEYTLLFSVPVEAFDMYLSEIEEENNINKYRNDENENEAEEEMNNDYHQYQHKHRHHYKHNKQYDINKAEIHIEHFDGQYDHFKISSMMGRNNIVEFIQILRKCRGLDYNKTLPIPTQFKNSCNKIKETERKLKHHQTKQQIMKETFMINDKKRRIKKKYNDKNT